MSKNIYTTIRDLPFDRFLSCLVDGCFHALCRDYDTDGYDYKPDKAFTIRGLKYFKYHIVKTHRPDILELVKTWQDIQNEFAQHIGGSDNLQYIELLASIGRLESKIERLELALASLQVDFNENIVQDLRAMGVPESLIRSEDYVRKVRLHAKQWDLLLIQKKTEYLKLQTKAADNDIKTALYEAKYDLGIALTLLPGNEAKATPTYELYEKILSEVDPKLDPSEITTLRFCILYNKLKNKAKAQAKHGAAGEHK